MQTSNLKGVAVIVFDYHYLYDSLSSFSLKWTLVLPSEPSPNIRDQDKVAFPLRYRSLGMVKEKQGLDGSRQEKELVEMVLGTDVQISEGFMRYWFRRIISSYLLLENNIFVSYIHFTLCLYFSSLNK